MGQEAENAPHFLSLSLLKRYKNNVVKMLIGDESIEHKLSTLPVSL